MTKLKTSLNSAHIKESDIQRQILDYLKSRQDIIAWRNHTQGVKQSAGRTRNPSAGMPDIIGIATICDSIGVFMAIEVKAPGKRVKPDSKQAKWIEAINNACGIAFEADSLEIAMERLDYNISMLEDYFARR